MKFNDNEFTVAEQKAIKENHFWMEQYYKPLKGAVINSVSISIDEKDQRIAFLCLDLLLVDGKNVQAEIVSTENINVPGLILGLPTEHLKEVIPPSSLN